MEERKDITSAVRESYLIIIWFVVIVGIRAFLLLSSRSAVLDEFGFFELVAGTEREITLTSGVAYAYEGTLSLLMRFTENGMEYVAVYQAILQTMALLFLFIGSRKFFGKGAAFLMGIVLGISPWMLNSIFQISPLNFYFFHWSVVFLLIGIFYKRTKNTGWFRNNAGEIYLLFTGFYLGVVCIWHYAGLTLIPFILFAQIKNAPGLRDRIIVRKNILDMEELMAEDEDSDEWWEDQWETELDPEKPVVDSREYMPTLSQSGVLIGGILLGAYSTLMKYTGVTGNFIKEQLIWWIGLYRFPVSGKLWQDIPLVLLLWVGGTILLGIITALILRFIYRKRRLEEQILEAEEYLKESESTDARQDTLTVSESWGNEMPELTESWSEPESEPEPIPEPEVAEPEPASEPEQQPQTEPAKKVKLIDNPLPIPKRQVKPKVEFDVEDENGDFDFDVDINTEDDFDV